MSARHNRPNIREFACSSARERPCISVGLASRTLIPLVLVCVPLPLSRLCPFLVKLGYERLSQACTILSHAFSMTSIDVANEMRKAGEMP
jgi:hypothetical protein